MKKSQKSRDFLKLSIALIFVVFIVSLLSCGPQQTGLQARKVGSHQRPSCANSQTAEELDLEQKTQDLYDTISQYHSKPEDRDSALEYYRGYVANLEVLKCPEEIERLLQKIIDAHS